MVTQTSSEVETKLAMSFDKAFKRTEEEEPQPPVWKLFQGGGGPPGAGPPGDEGRAGGPPGGPPGGPGGGDPVPTGPNLPANL